MARFQGRSSDELRIGERTRWPGPAGPCSASSNDCSLCCFAFCFECMISSPAKSFPWTIGIGIALLAMTLLLVFLLASLKSRVAPRSSLPVYGQVSDFSLTNQNGRPMSLADLQGKVWVADIIFTRCPGPCFTMSRQMQELAGALPPGSDARLVSLTTDPDFDTPQILARYGERFSADTNKWFFLTGTKKEISHLAIDSLKLATIEKKPEERESADDLFVHSTIFVVVDKRGKLRGVYETVGEGIDWAKSRQQILTAVRELEQER
jgi:protein SCO1